MDEKILSIDFTSYFVSNVKNTLLKDNFPLFSVLKL